MRSLFLVAAALVWAGPSGASPTLDVGDWQLTLSGQIRPRLIVDSGRDFVEGDSEVEREYVTQRSRLGVKFAKKEGPSLFVQIQDARIWGEEANTLDGASRGTDFHQAYADFPMLLLTARLGRQEIVFDDARLVGNVGWTQRARTFDAGRLMIAGDAYNVDAFIASLRETDTDGDGHVTDTSGGPSWFAGVHGHWKTGPTLGISTAFYAVRNGPTDTNRYTAGVYLKGASEGFVYEGQGWYQFGEIASESIGAWMTGARLGYTLSVAGKPSLLLWAEMLSGDGTPEAAFDTLFATNHKFYGEMDIFVAVPRQTGALGLMDAGGRVAVTAADYLKFHLDTHILRAMEADAADETSFGTELDFVAGWKTDHNVSGRFLFGLFLPGEALRGPRGIPTEDLAIEKLLFVTIDWKI